MPAGLDCRWLRFSSGARVPLQVAATLIDQRTTWLKLSMSITSGENWQLSLWCRHGCVRRPTTYSPDGEQEQNGCRHVADRVQLVGKTVVVASHV